MEAEIKLRRREDGAYPITKEQFHGMYPNVDIGNNDALDALGFDAVIQVEPPEHTVLDSLRELAPVFDEGAKVWRQAWHLEDVSSTLPSKVVEEVLTEYRRKYIRVLAEARYKAETEGIMRNGNFIPTSRQDFQMVLETLIGLQLEPDNICSWKTPIGSWVNVDLSFIAKVYKIMNAHRQRCFAAERGAYERIINARHPLDMKSIIDTLVWPT
jgi:hypothetical protein